MKKRVFAAVVLVALALGLGTASVASAKGCMVCTSKCYTVPFFGTYCFDTDCREGKRCSNPFK